MAKRYNKESNRPITYVGWFAVTNVFSYDPYIWKVVLPNQKMGKYTLEI